MRKSSTKKYFAATALLLSLCFLMQGCTPPQSEFAPSKENPVTIEIWHYYNGPQKNAFDNIVTRFNQTIGEKRGIIVEAFNSGNVNELADKVYDSAQGKVGARDIPNIFAAYADTAYKIEKLGAVCDLEQYLTEEDIERYVPSYIEEGRLGVDQKLKIFPIAKSTEVLVLNKTDFDPFSKARGVGYEDLETIEGLCDVARKYYEWTDAKTPEIKDDGKAFFGRDAMANYIIIGNKQLGTEIFEVGENGKVKFNLDKDDMKKLWDNYYVPYIKGYFLKNSEFASEDVRLGDTLALVGSTTSIGFFPDEVICESGDTRKIETAILRAPIFRNGQKFAVQQGAGMVVTKTTPQEEYASVEFLKWFTKSQNNLEFSLSSYYLPVTTEAMDLAVSGDSLVNSNEDMTDLARSILLMGYEIVRKNTLYTNKAFENGDLARKIIDSTFDDKLENDINVINKLVADGMSRNEAVAMFNTQENFDEWFNGLTSDLEALIREE